MLKCSPSTIPIDAGKYLTKDTSTYLVDLSFHKKIIGQLMFANNSRFGICFAGDNSHSL